MSLGEGSNDLAAVPSPGRSPPGLGLPRQHCEGPDCRALLPGPSCCVASSSPSPSLSLSPHC